MLIHEFQAHCWITHHYGDVFNQGDLFVFNRLHLWRGSRSYHLFPHPIL